MLNNLQELLEPLQPYLLAIIAIGAAIVLLPLLIRLIVGRTVTWLAGRRYLSHQLAQMMEGWSDERTRHSLEAIAALANSRLRHRLVSNFSLADDTRAVVLLAQQSQRSGRSKKQISYRFSLLKLIQCSLLVFCDLQAEFGCRRWFRAVGRLRLERVLQKMRTARSSDQLLHRRLVSKLREMPLIWRIPAMLLAPVVAAPLMLFYLVRSLFGTTLHDGLVRYFYGLFLLRFGYYALYLYSRENTVISRRLEGISPSQLASLAEKIEAQLDPKNWTPHSVFFNLAVERYGSLLGDFELPADPVCVPGESRSRRAIGRAFSVLRKVARKQAFRERPVDDSHQLVRLYRALGRVYSPGHPHPVGRLRLVELLDLGYMATVLALHKATSVPGGRALLDNVSLNIALTINGLRDDEDLRRFGLSLAGMYRKTNVARKANQMLGAMALRSFPVVLAVNLAGDVALQQLTDHYRGFVYHRVGRLLLYGYEQNTLGRSTKGARLVF